MCGIVDHIGKEEAAPILLNGLSRLEYRGYDSAGVAVWSEEDGLRVAIMKQPSDSTRGLDPAVLQLLYHGHLKTC